VKQGMGDSLMDGLTDCRHSELVNILYKETGQVERVTCI